MAHTENRAGHHASTVRRPGPGLKPAAVAIAALKSWQRTASRRRSIQDLTPDRLRDIGQAEAPAPELEVKAGLIANLISMR